MAKATKTTKTAKTAKPAVKKAKPAKTTTKRKSPLSQLNYALSPELQEIVGEKKATRPQVVKKLWAYIKSKKLQDTKNRRMINPDEKLAEVFGSKKSVDMLKMAGLLSKHIKKA